MIAVIGTVAAGIGWGVVVFLVVAIVVAVVAIVNLVRRHGNVRK